MLNPITQFKQHKAVQVKGNPPTAKVTTASNKVEKQEDKPKTLSGHKGKLTLNHYPQVDYLFQQTKWGVANCKQNYPDCFHFKKALQKQLNAICQTLNKSDRLLAELIMPTQSGNSRQSRENIPEKVGKKATLTTEQQKTLKHHRQAVRYLIKQMQEVADYVEQVEQAEGEQLNALCYRKE